jgi:hypothetical protein
MALVSHGDPNHIPAWYDTLLSFLREHRQQIERVNQHHLSTSISRSGKNNTTSRDA